MRWKNVMRWQRNCYLHDAQDQVHWVVVKLKEKNTLAIANEFAKIESIEVNLNYLVSVEGVINQNNGTVISQSTSISPIKRPYASI